MNKQNQFQVGDLVSVCKDLAGFGREPIGYSVRDGGAAFAPAATRLSIGSYGIIIKCDEAITVNLFELDSYEIYSQYLKKVNEDV